MGKARITVTGPDGLALKGATIVAVAEHPIGRSEPFALHFVQMATGEFLSSETLPAGRWKLKTTVSRGTQSMRVVQDIR